MNGLRVLCAVLLSCFVLDVMAENYKIGFVNTERILHDSYPAKQAQDRVSHFFLQRLENLKKMESSLESLKAQLEKQVITMPQAQRHQLQKQVDDESRAFQKAQNQLNEAVDAERNEEYQSIVQKANQVIKMIADRDHYDLIFQEAVYVSTRVDITDEVIRRLNSEKDSSSDLPEETKSQVTSLKPLK